MSKTITIPDWMDPYVVHVNGLNYVYKAGETISVPDGVAAIIQADIDAHEAANEQGGPQRIVRSVNGVAPDENGNVQVEAGSSGVYVSELPIFALSPADYANRIVYCSSFGTLHLSDGSSWINLRGVTSVAGMEPDEEGNISFVPCMTGVGEPQPSGNWRAGCLYMDVDTGDMYKYLNGVWKPLVESGGGGVIVGRGEPTNLTPGVVGSLYVSEATSKLYVCVAVDGDGNTLWMIQASENLINWLERRIITLEEKSGSGGADTLTLTVAFDGSVTGNYNAHDIFTRLTNGNEYINVFVQDDKESRSCSATMYSRSTNVYIPVGNWATITGDMLTGSWAYEKIANEV